MPPDADVALAETDERLRAWLAEQAFPIWRQAGFDPATGRFGEKIGLDGAPLDLPSRGRVPPRQIYAFATAPSLGWWGDAEHVVRAGLSGYLRDHQRPDGLFRPFGAGAAGADDGVELYDQAFALFGLAAAHPLVEGGLERQAVRLRLAIRAQLSRDGGGFWASWPPRPRLESNPHMHLLEACLAWREQSRDPAWEAMAEEIVELALERFIEPRTGALVECVGEGGASTVEPGHQYEWAWLLLTWSRIREDRRLRPTALRLIELAERHGVDRRRGVAIDALAEDLSAQRTTARLWPQTERIKAAALAGRMTGEAGYLRIAAEAAEALAGYFRTPIQGLWWDRMDDDGSFRREPAPASSLYHIVLAAQVLQGVVREPAQP